YERRQELESHKDDVMDILNEGSKKASTAAGERMVEVRSAMKMSKQCKFLMIEQLKIHLPHYEGPLDLLLDLIRRQKLDIYDIPIAKVTEQYLDYLHKMEEMNIDLASEFLLTAAQLIYIKSRMLLPPDPDASPEEH